MSDVTLLAEVTTFYANDTDNLLQVNVRPETARTSRSLTQPPAKSSPTLCRQTPAQAEEAMQSARRAFDVWRKMPTLQRGALLLKLADTLAAHREELAQLESVCSGKTITLSRGLELDQSVAFLRYFAGWAGK